MRELLKKHRIEVAVAVLSTVVCAYYLYPEISAQLGNFLGADQGRGRSSRPDPSGIIYHRRGNYAMLRGSSPRAAVEAKLTEIRGKLEKRGIDWKVANWSDIQVSLVTHDKKNPEFSSVFFRGLAWADMRGLDLTGIDLRGMKMQGCSFRRTNLSGAMLSGAEFRFADFVGANLSNVDCRDVGFPWPMREVSFRGANFEGANLAGTEQCDFTDANLKGSHIRVSGMQRTVFDGADMRDAELHIFRYVAEVTEDNRFWALGEPEDGQGRTKAFLESTKRSVLISAERCYREVQFNDATQVEGLKLIGAAEIDAPFIEWALARGAVATAAEEEEELGIVEGGDERGLRPRTGRGRR